MSEVEQQVNSNDGDIEIGLETMIPNEIEVNGTIVDAITVQLQQPNHVNVKPRPEAAQRTQLKQENTATREANIAIAVTTVISVMQTAASGVISLLTQGSPSPSPENEIANQTSKNRLVSLATITPMCGSYLFTLCVVGLRVFGEHIPHCSAVIKILVLAAFGSFTLGIVLGVVFYFQG